MREEVCEMDGLWIKRNSVKARLNKLCISCSFAHVSRHGIINYVYSYKSVCDLVYVLSLLYAYF